MTPSVESDPSTSVRPRRRLVRLTALGVTVGVAAAAIVGSTGASAAATTYKTQSVGRFVDGSVGGNPIQQLADVVDARAKAAPNTSSRNPLEAKLLGQLDLPLGSALKLPGGGALNLGAANQLADAKTDGSSLGASGAVSNSGGVSLGGDDTAFPANAKLNLSAAALGAVSLPGLPTLPGLPAGLPTGSLDALGGITGSIGAVSGIVQTNKGGKIVTPKSSVATVKLNIGSPALGALLKQLTGILNPSVLTNLIPTSSLPTGGLSALPGGLGGILGPILGPVGVPTGGSTSTGCSLTAATPSTTISLDQGAVTIDASTATITVDVGKLLKVLLGKDISNLDTSNFDLIDFLVTNLPKILSTGLTSLVTGITDPLEAQFKACVGLLNAVPILGSVTTGLINQLLGALDTGKTQLLSAISAVTAPLTSASGAPLTALASGLKQVIDIGLNVQSGPGIQKKESTYPFTTGLKATPNQATAVVAKQTLVRAIEIDVLSAAGGAAGSLPAIPGLGFRQAAAPRALAAAGGVAVLALGNAAAGPSTPTTVRPSPSPTNPGSSIPGQPNTAIPTGVPAGAAGHTGGGSPALPIVIVLIGLVLAGGGVTAYRFRGKFSH